MTSLCSISQRGRRLLLALLSRSNVQIKRCTSLKLNGLASRDVNLLLGLWVDPFTSWLVSYRESTETKESNLFSLLEFFSYDGSEGFYSSTSIYLSEACLLCYTCDEICLVHELCYMGCTMC